MRLFPLALAIGFAALSFTVPPACAGEDQRAKIADAYRAIDEAVRHRDADAMVAALTPDFVQIQPGGTTRTLAELRDAAARQFHPANLRVYPEQDTNVRAIAISGDHATARGTQQALVGLVDAAGNAVAAREDATFEDRWVRTPAGWRLQRSHVLTAIRTSRTMPSPAMQQIIAQMHEQNEMLRRFGSNVSASNCYHSAGMQKYTPADREQMCSQH